MAKTTQVAKQTTIKLITTHEIVVDSPLLAKLGIPNGSFGTARTTHEWSVSNSVMQTLINSLKGADKSMLVQALNKVLESIIPVRPGAFSAGYDLGEMLKQASQAATAGGEPKSWPMPGEPSPFPPPPPPPPPDPSLRPRKRPASS